MAPKKGKEGSLNTSGEEEGEGGQAGSWAEGLAKGEFCFCYCFRAAAAAGLRPGNNPNWVPIWMCFSIRTLIK